MIAFCREADVSARGKSREEPRKAKKSLLLPASSLVAVLGLYHMAVKFLTYEVSRDFG